MKRKIRRFQKAHNGIQYILGNDVRKELSPFVFFDAGTHIRNDEGLFIGMHPHSGIGIITYFEGAYLDHDDSGNNDEIIRSGGVQWIRSGSAVWHQEHYRKSKDEKASSWPLTIHQLWFQLPPELEESEVEYINFQPEVLPIVDNVKIIAGEYRGIRSPLHTPYNLTYLDVEIGKGKTFTFETPDNQTRGFIFPREGEASLYSENLPLNHLSILDENEGLIEIEAQVDFKAVLVLTEPYSYPIVTGSGSIHTNEVSLINSEKKIRITYENQ
jgi:quercetin 2,3-dioxygenase